MNYHLGLCFSTTLMFLLLFLDFIIVLLLIAQRLELALNDKTVILPLNDESAHHGWDMQGFLLLI